MSQINRYPVKVTGLKVTVTVEGGRRFIEIDAPTDMVHECNIIKLKRPVEGIVEREPGQAPGGDLLVSTAIAMLRQIQHTMVHVNNGGEIKFVRDTEAE